MRVMGIRAVRILVAATVSLGCAFAQSNENSKAGKTIYFLKDDSHKQWCGYASESRFKAQIQALAAMIVGGADYSDGRVSTLHFTETDETGDWAVNDTYTLNESGVPESLKRTINILPEGTSEEQFFLIQNGKAIKQRSTYRDLSTGKPTQKRVDWFKGPPVMTKLETSPFSTLIGSKRMEVMSKGETCIRMEKP